jgi:hypothetical protein
MTGRRIGLGLAGCALLAALCSGCTAARSNLGTSDASCYLSLPTATHAVGSHGRLVGFRQFSLKDLSRVAPHLYRAISDRQSTSQQVCVIAFTGSFTSGHVSKPKGRPSGKLAVVVSTTPNNQLLGTVIFRKAPLHFGHTHVL